jgi:pimeloyl-ACP methyl ester carboxylesterase
LDLALGLKEDLGSGAVRNFLGACADDPEARSLACPSALLPMGVPSMCVHGTADEDVPPSQSQRFVAAARRAGDDSRLLVLPGTDHYSLIDVTSPAWAACRTAVLDLAR